MPSRCRGAHCTTLSTRRSISAASLADRSTCSLTLKDSMMPMSNMSASPPSCMFSPQVCSPAKCFALSLATRSAASSPPLVAMISGMARRPRAKASMASACLPGTSRAASSIAWAMVISHAPPPGTTLVCLTVCESTQSASWRDRSASSRMCVLAPRSTMLQASALGTPEKRMSLSSPIITSSMSSASPRVTWSGVSKVLTMSPRVTSASCAMPSKSACSMTMTPFSPRRCSGRL
mmetsp:Transcript_19685/g.66171  ORF Transcript_19685/g.66171 Transcript_19685/m.66171 type:complete len:235 (+) Transcript_19685:372-1076(+)